MGLRGSFSRLAGKTPEETEAMVDIKLKVARALLAEAVLAVHRTDAPGLEGHHGLRAAFGAGDLEHLPGAVAVDSRDCWGAALSTPCRAAVLASLRLIGKASRREELLLTSSEYKAGPAVHTV